MRERMMERETVSQEREAVSNMRERRMRKRASTVQVWTERRGTVTNVHLSHLLTLSTGPVSTETRGLVTAMLACGRGRARRARRGMWWRM
jgi:hypothetical protein